MRRTALLCLALVAAAACSRGGPETGSPTHPSSSSPSTRCAPITFPPTDYAGVQTPHLDRLRPRCDPLRAGVLHVPLTLPAHVSMLTGPLPFEHGVRDNLGYRFDAEGAPDAPGLLKTRGYATGGRRLRLRAPRRHRHRRGLRLYDDKMAAPFGTDALGRVQRRARRRLRIASRWLARGEGQAVLPLLPHLRAARALRAAGALQAATRCLRRRGRGRRRRSSGASSTSCDGSASTIARSSSLLSDHGEGLGEHGEDEHGILLYRWALHVPLARSSCRARAARGHARDDASPARSTCCRRSRTVLGLALRRRACAAARS